MRSNKKISLAKRWEELINKILTIKEQNESGFMIGYEDLVKSSSEGLLLNWISVGPTKKLKKEIQKLISERVKRFKNNSKIYVFPYDNNYYEDVVIAIIEQKGIIVEQLCSMPYIEAYAYIKEFIVNISDEEIYNYIAQDKDNHKTLIKRLQ